MLRARLAAARAPSFRGATDFALRPVFNSSARSFSSPPPGGVPGSGPTPPAVPRAPGTLATKSFSFADAPAAVAGVVSRVAVASGRGLLSAGRWTATSVHILATDPARARANAARLWVDAKDEMRHYYLGSKLLWAEIKLSVGLLRQIASGLELTRRERQLLRRIMGDLVRVVPLLVVVIVPFAELGLPFLIRFKLLPSQFEKSGERADAYKKSLSSRVELHGVLSEVLADLTKQKAAAAGAGAPSARELLRTLEAVRSGAPMTSGAIVQVAALFKDELTLDTLPHGQLVTLAKYVGLSPFAPDPLLRHQLKVRMKELREDDVFLMREGGAKRLTKDELKAASEARGMRAVGLAEEQYAAQLDEWLTLSVKSEVPVCLLMLSRSFSIAAPFIATSASAPPTAPAAWRASVASDATAAALQEAVSSIPKVTVSEMVLDQAPSAPPTLQSPLPATLPSSPLANAASIGSSAAAQTPVISSSSLSSAPLQVSADAAAGVPVQAAAAPSRTAVPLQSTAASAAPASPSFSHAAPPPTAQSSTVTTAAAAAAAAAADNLSGGVPVSTTAAADSLAILELKLGALANQQILIEAERDAETAATSRDKAAAKAEAAARAAAAAAAEATRLHAEAVDLAARAAAKRALAEAKSAAFIRMRSGDAIVAAAAASRDAAIADAALAVSVAPLASASLGKEKAALDKIKSENAALGVSTAPATAVKAANVAAVTPGVVGSGPDSSSPTSPSVTSTVAGSPHDDTRSPSAAVAELSSATTGDAQSASPPALSPAAPAAAKPADATTTYLRSKLSALSDSIEADISEGEQSSTLRHALTAADANGDGLVSAAEIAAAAVAMKSPLAQDAVDALVRRLDTDKDGLVSIKEVESYLEKAAARENNVK
jgi:hypothetical protein